MKARTFLWYLQRPSFYPYMVEEIARKFRRPDRRTIEERNIATERCKKESMTLDKFQIPDEYTDYAYKKEDEHKTGLGAGKPFEGLLGSLILSRGFRYVLETGVATGWSSLEVLAALKAKNLKHHLISTDMPYPTKNFEPFVGCVVPESLRGNWSLIKKPDRNGLFDAFNLHDGDFDLMHYDSDKSYWGRMWAYSLMIRRLSRSGVFVSDDIGDNLAFFEFCENNNFDYVVIDKDEDGRHFSGVIDFKNKL